MKKKLLVTFLSLAMALTMGNACVYAAEASGSAAYTDPSGGQTTVDEFYTVTKDAGRTMVPKVTMLKLNGKGPMVLPKVRAIHTIGMQQTRSM